MHGLSRRPAAGQCTLTLSGVVGQAYELQASSDLLTWTTVASGTFTAGSAQVVNTVTGQEPRRFYRIKLLTPGP